MDVVLALLAGGRDGALTAALGAAAGAAAVLVCALLLRRGRIAPPPPAPLADQPPVDLELSRRSVETLSTALVVIDPGDEIALANPAARRLGVVKDGRLPHPMLRALVRQARRTGEACRTELELERGRNLEPLGVRAQAAWLGPGGHVALEVEDITEEHRVAKVRRDFVANVSHELKTPVGALALLAEALLDAVDDPEAVERFARRMQHESSRLGRLVQELIDLSRLQGADPLPEPETVLVDVVVSEVVDRTRLAAEARGIALVSGGDHGLTVQGSESQIITALANLVDNAIAYSPEHTRVAIGTRRRDGLVEISVSDQGIGIAEPDLDRIFERFYRADPARSRATGGTGLGLAIVKHIATNHGGSVDVWSIEGSGSTFTLRLPDDTEAQLDSPAVVKPAVVKGTA
ncbi:MAG: two-component system, OmpR family, sensor histidine kinase SenX3 [Cryptosporangiaceae bacterium]|nr:two-component system, OmpR family, sensor histidine kinase SenX3 [Cryptosporangiaceae bacterium]